MSQRIRRVRGGGGKDDGSGDAGLRGGVVAVLDRLRCVDGQGDVEGQEGGGWGGGVHVTEALVWRIEIVVERGGVGRGGGGGGRLWAAAGRGEGDSRDGPMAKV